MAFQSIVPDVGILWFLVTVRSRYQNQQASGGGGVYQTGSITRPTAILGGGLFYGLVGGMVGGRNHFDNNLGGGDIGGLLGPRRGSAFKLVARGGYQNDLSHGIGSTGSNAGGSVQRAISGVDQKKVISGVDQQVIDWNQARTVRIALDHADDDGPGRRRTVARAGQAAFGGGERNGGDMVSSYEPQVHKWTCSHQSTQEAGPSTGPVPPEALQAALRSIGIGPALVYLAEKEMYRMCQQCKGLGFCRAARSAEEVAPVAKQEPQD